MSQVRNGRSSAGKAAVQACFQKDFFVTCRKCGQLYKHILEGQDGVVLLGCMFWKKQLYKRKLHFFINKSNNIIISLDQDGHITV